MRAAPLLGLLVAVSGVGAARANPCEASPSARVDDATRWADAIWRAVAAAELRLGGTSTPRLRVSDMPQSGAWYCRDLDTVVVSRAFVDYAWLGRPSDGADLLAFALAHELAHRRFDPRDDAGTGPAHGDAARGLDVIGGLAPASCPASDLPREARADARAAFLVATAIDPSTQRGFSPFNLARRDALGAFFTAELGWPPTCPAVTARVAAVGDAVARISTLGRLFDAALLASLVPGAEVDPVGLVHALDLAANGPPSTPATPWSAVPELKLATAMAHLERVAEVGWCTDTLARAPLTPSPCALRCVPVAPGFAMLAAVDAVGERAPPVLDRELELAAAERALREATALGATPLQRAGVQVCADVLARDPAAARANLAVLHQGLARRTDPAALRMRARLRDLGALVALQEALFEEEAPIGTASWLDGMRERAEAKDLRGDGDAALALGAWLGMWPTSSAIRPSRASLPDTAEGSSQRPLRAPPIRREVEWPRAPCESLARVRLGGEASVALGPGCIELRRGEVVALRFVDVTATTRSATMADWDLRCTVGLRAASAEGLEVFLARCAEDASRERWLVFASEGRVQRVVHVGLRP